MRRSFAPSEYFRAQAPCRIVRLDKRKSRACKEAAVRGRVLLFLIAHAALIGSALALMR